MKTEIDGGGGSGFCNTSTKRNVSLCLQTELSCWQTWAYV